ncbi:MAG: hypothetical protein ACJA0U_003333 [Salibacteraceae bacterium]|jgi:hypothetical protein
MLSLLKDCLRESYLKKGFQNELLEIKVTAKFANTPTLDDFLLKFSSLRDLLNSSHINSPFNSEKIQGASNLFILSTKSRFLSRLLSKYDNPNWVDIESEYFTYLHETATGGAQNKTKLIEELNSDLKIISDYFQNYLKKIDDEFDISKYDSEFKDRINKLLFNKIIHSSGTVGQKYKALVVNFNYTNTVSHYIENNPHEYDVETIDLHGSVGSEEVIFGYGHIDNPQYQQLKNSGNDEFLKGLKLFNYHKQSKYTQLRDFIQKGNYDIYM